MKILEISNHSAKRSTLSRLIRLLRPFKGMTYSTSGSGKYSRSKQSAYHKHLVDTFKQLIPL